MQYFGIFVIAVCVLAVVTLLLLCAKHEKSFRFLLLNILISIAVVVVLNLTSRFSGVHIPINKCSAACVTVFGVPGIIAMLIMNLL